MKKIPSFTRRNFLNTIAAGSAGLGATLGRMELANASVTASSDYKALVCFYLYGGNDSFNMIAPKSAQAYDEYAEIRQGLAMPKDALIGAKNLENSGKRFGFHPSTEKLKTLFAEKKLAVMGNVGALVEPLDRDQFLKRTRVRPEQLFSHNSQQEFVMSASGKPRGNDGWAARMSACLDDANLDKTIPLNFTTTGSNPWQRSSTVLPYTIARGGLQPLEGFSRDTNASALDANRAASLARMLKLKTNHAFKKEYANIYRRSWDLSDQLIEIIDSQAVIKTRRPAGNPAAIQFFNVAKMIQSRADLGMKRQIFFVGLGGFDTHDAQNERQPELLSTVSDAMAYFNDVLEELGIQDQVTTFTASDFGRTLSSNGDGSDHGWGGHQLIMGGAVKGGKIYGSIPDYAPETEYDAGEGRLIPTTSIDQYAGTLARWFGLSASEVADIFPTIGNFENADIGFMQS